MTAAPLQRLPPAARPPKAVLVRVDDVQFHPRNVRRDLGDLRELTNSVALYGLMQPIVVEIHGDALRLRAGHRRLAAARLAGLFRIPALVHDHALAEDEWVLQALHENTMRRNLDPGERADAIRRLKHLGKSTVEIAANLGVSVGTVRSWAAGVEAVPTAPIEPADAESATRRPDARVTGQRPVRPRKSLSTSVLIRFATAWREQHKQQPVAVEELLDALEQVAGTGRITDAMPGAHVAEPEGV